MFSAIFYKYTAPTELPTRSLAEIACRFFCFGESLVKKDEMNWERIKLGVCLALAILILIQEFYGQVQRHEGLHFSSTAVTAILLIFTIIFGWPDLKKPN